MPLEFEIDNFPFMPAMYSRPFTGTRKIRLVIIHSMEMVERIFARSSLWAAGVFGHDAQGHTATTRGRA